jgi:hypothetical protein
MIGDHDPMCELARQGSTGIRRGWVCSCKDYAAVRADERERILADLPVPKYNGEWWYYFTDVHRAINGDTDAR